MITEIVANGRDSARRFGVDFLHRKEFKLIRDGKAWIRYSEGINLEQFEKDISATDLFVSDLDDTIAPSPALQIAVDIGKNNFLNLNFLRWVAYSTGQVFSNADNAVSNSWKYLDHALQDHPVFQRSIHGWTEDKVREKSYEGFSDVCQVLPQNAKRLLISRNHPYIVSMFSQVYGFESYPYQFQKGNTIKSILEENPNMGSVLIIGDSKEDGEMVEAVREKGKKVLSVCVCPNEGKSGFTADIYASVKNQKLLAKMMGGKL